MTAWQKEEIEIESGEKVSAQMPVIVSASRSTDIPAFYSDWFVERFNGGDGYVRRVQHLSAPLPLLLRQRQQRRDLGQLEMPSRMSTGGDDYWEVMTD